MKTLSDAQLRISRRSSSADLSAEPRILSAGQRTPPGESEELRRLRDELAEKNKQIALLTRQINSPVFLLRATIRKLIHVIPYVIRRLRDERRNANRGVL